MILIVNSCISVELSDERLCIFKATFLFHSWRWRWIYQTWVIRVFTVIKV